MRHDDTGGRNWFYLPKKKPEIGRLTTGAPHTNSCTAKPVIASIARRHRPAAQQTAA